MIMSYVGAYTGFFYTSFYGRQAGFTNKSLSFYLVPILNGSSFFGRTLPNMLSDKIGPTNVLIPSVLCLGIALLCMLAVQNAVGMVVAAIFFGFFSGVIVAIPPVIFVALVKDKSKVGTRVGMGFAFIGFGVLTGGPGAGAVLGKRSADLANYHPNWTGIWTFAGVFSLVGCCILTAARVMMGGKKIMVKV
jgi:MFS family permease